MSAAVSGASAKAIQRHYDVGNDFYRLFLDDTRTYSCALFDPETQDDLETAQLRKLDWHARHSGAIGADRVLDVGCGWGSGLTRWVNHHGAGHAVGLTLSDAQAEHAAATCGPGIEVRVENWLDHQPAEPYDALISVGAFEHFARYGQSPQEKLASYRRYFERCREFLSPDAGMSLQTIAYGDIPRGQVFRDTFIADEVFPESDLPYLAEIAQACEGLFEISLVRNDREHYARTCRMWFNRLRARHDEAVALVGPEVTARYERFLRTFSYSFSLGAFQLLRIALRRSGRPRQVRARP